MENNQPKNGANWVYIIIVIVVVGIGIYLSTRSNSNTDILEDNTIETNVQNTTNNELEGKSEDEVSANTNTSANTSTNTGVVSKPGDVLVMNYTGRLQNGVVFDSNVDPKFSHVQPFVFTLGAGQVIQGWDEGLVGMKVGEKKTLTISPEKAYGSRAIGSIPANSTLIFDVELVAINPKQ